MLVLTNQGLILYCIFLSGFYTSSLISIINDFKKNTEHTQHKELYSVYSKTIPLVSLNVFVFIPITIYFLQNVFSILSEFRFIQILDIPLSIFIVDFSFYAFHYMFHQKRLLNLYKYHKIHHQIKSPVSISSLYLHPVDLVFGNIVPLFLPIFLLRSSFITLCVWTFMTIFETTYKAHSGIKNLSEDHDNHHRYFIYNYGSGLYICDRIMNTYFN